MTTSEEVARYIGDPAGSSEGSGDQTWRWSVSLASGWRSKLRAASVTTSCSSKNPGRPRVAPGSAHPTPTRAREDALVVEDPEDAAFAAELLRRTWAALPAPRRKKPTQKK